MVQTLTLWSNGVAEINDGENFLLSNGNLLSAELQAKLNEIEGTISANGISQIHIEKDTFREFEHVVTAGVVVSNEFGTTVSAADFNWIMQSVVAEIEAQSADQALSQAGGVGTPEII